MMHIWRYGGGSRETQFRRISTRSTWIFFVMQLTWKWDCSEALHHSWLRRPRQTGWTAAVWQMRLGELEIGLVLREDGQCPLLLVTEERLTNLVCRYVALLETF